MKLLTLTLITTLSSSVFGQSLNFSVPASNVNNRAPANGIVYNGDGAGGPGRTANSSLGGIEINIQNYNGIATNTTALAFCVEFDTPVYVGSDYTYDLSTNIGGIDGGLAAGLDSKQIGQVSYLFDSYYQDAPKAEWNTNSAGTPNDQLFQFALWELTHDDDLSLSNTNGNFYSTESSVEKTGAQEILDDLANATFDFSSYTSSQWEIYHVTSDTYQNLVFAKSTANPIGSIPEPSSALLALLGGLTLLKRKRS